MQNRHLAVTSYNRFCCVTQMKRNIKKPFIDDRIITSLIQRQDVTLLALATGENWRIYQLNTE